MYLHELLLLARPQLSLTWYKKWATEINNHIKLYVNEKWEIKWEKGRGEELSWSNNETLIMVLDIHAVSRYPMAKLWLLLVKPRRELRGHFLKWNSH